MSQKQTSRFCLHCERRVMATGSSPNHLLHFFLSIFTLGLWVPAWVLVMVGSVGGYRCARCGTRV